jgi:hypothetical protein
MFTFFSPILKKSVSIFKPVDDNLFNLSSPTLQASLRRVRLPTNRLGPHSAYTPICNSVSLTICRSFRTMAKSGY